MPSFVLDAAERSALANVLRTDLAGGFIAIYTAAYTLLLVTIPLANPCGSVADGVLTLDCAAANANAVAGAPSNAAVAKFFKSDGTTLVATADVAVSGATINLQNISIASGQNVSIASGTITVPAGT